MDIQSAIAIDTELRSTKQLLYSYTRGIQSLRLSTVLGRVVRSVVAVVSRFI